MADFTQSYVGGPQGSPVSPQAPATDTSSLATLEFLGDAVSGLGNAATNFMAVRAKQEKERLQVEQQNQQDQVVGLFSRQQLALVDALETGQITSSAEVRMRMRANLSNSIANNPALATELAKAHTTVIKNTGLGNVVTEGTEAEQQEQAFMKEAVSAGWVNPSWSQEKKQVAVDRYRNFQLTKQQMEFNQKQVTLQTSMIKQKTASIDQQSAILGLQEKKQAQQSRAAIGSLVDNYGSHFGDLMADIGEDLAASRITPEQAVMQADAEWNKVVAVASGVQVGPGASTDYVNNMLSPMKLLYDNSKKYFSGEIKRETLENAVAAATSAQSLLILGDPEVAMLVGANKLGLNAGPGTMQLMDNAVARVMSQNTSEDGSEPVNVLSAYKPGKDNISTYLKGVTDVMNRVNTDTVVGYSAQEVQKDVNTNVNNIFKGIDVYQGGAETKDFAPVLDFLADTTTGTFLSKQGGPTDQGAAARAQNALQFQFKERILPLIEESYNRTVAGGTQTLVRHGRAQTPTFTGTKPTSELIKPVFVGSGITFVNTSNDKSPLTQRKVKELNDQVASVVNKMIRATAHVSGNTDYKAAWNVMIEMGVFGLNQPEEPAEANQGQTTPESTTPDYGLRADGTKKGSGYFGELRLPTGEVATEYSVGVEFDGQEQEIPTLVPTLTEAEKNQMVNDIIPNGKDIPDSIMRKAVEHARKRMAAGQSPFK